MLVVSLGGAVLGSKDSAMAVSRAWGHSFAGLRRLHSIRSVPFSIRSHPTFEPIVQQTPKSAGHLRFIAQAAALEESSELSHKKGGRLSRSERYAVVEAFVSKHKDSHEGSWPSLNAILKETGGSRTIVKDIVEELEKKENGSAEAEHLSSENLAASNFEEEHEDSDSKYDGHQEPTHLSHDDNETEEDSEESFVDDPSDNRPGRSTLKSRDIESTPGLWSRLRNLGQPENNNERAVDTTFETYDSEDEEEEEEEEEDDNEEDFTADDYDRSKDVGQRDASWNQTKSSGGRSTSDSYTGENYGLFIRFLPLAATETDLRAAFQDCGEIVRAQAMVPKGSGLKFTYGFVDFSTPEALSKALNKDKVSIKGSTILTEACSGPRRVDSRPTNSRRPATEHFKKSEPYRNSDRNFDRPGNGFRSPPVVNKFRRGEALAGSENGTQHPINNGTYLVAVEGLSYPMPISAVEKMLAAHGDISRSELTREDGGTYSAHVEFKTEEGRASALASGRVYLGGRWCRISTGEPILTTVVRLSNVGNVSESFILQRCAKMGRVDNIVQRKEGVVDVYYHPSERRNMRKILDRLGEVNADFKRWHANLAPRCTLEEIRNSPEIQDWVDVQKDRLLDSLTGAMKLMTIDLEDLRDLVDAERSDHATSGKPRNFERSSASKTNRL